MATHPVATRILEVLAHRPAGLFSDFDGVMSEIAPTPESAIAYPGVADAFARIAEKVDAAGVITGRALKDIAARLPIEELIVVGNHGLEWSERGDLRDHEAGLAAVDAVTAVLDQTQRELTAQTDITGMIWENKRLSGTIHFRNAGDPAEIESLVLPIVQPLADLHNLRCTPGKMIVELRPMAMVTKGTALTEIVETEQLASAIFIGDDVTDVDGFRALSELRASGTLTLSIGVVTVDAHPDVATYADVIVGSVAETVDVLSQVADLLGD